MRATPGWRQNASRVVRWSVARKRATRVSLAGQTKSWLARMVRGAGLSPLCMGAIGRHQARRAQEGVVARSLLVSCGKRDGCEVQGPFACAWGLANEVRCMGDKLEPGLAWKTLGKQALCREVGLCCWACTCLGSRTRLGWQLVRWA